MQGNSFASFWGGFEILCIEKVVKTLDFENVQGYGVESVQINSSGEPSIDIMQLVVNEIAQPALIEENAEQDLVFKHVCPNCGRSWYDHYARGRMPLRRSALRQGLDFQRLYEWFGNGSTARREILISQRIARLIREHNWAGLRLSPVLLV